MKKDRLRSLGREYSDNAIIEVAQGLPAKESMGMSEEQKKEIKQLYCEIFEVPDLISGPNPPTINDLLQAL